MQAYFEKNNGKIFLVEQILSIDSDFHILTVPEETDFTLSQAESCWPSLHPVSSQLYIDFILKITNK